MAPFLVESLETLSRTFCRRFIRKEILDAALTTLKFIKINISDKCNQVNCAQFDLGFSIKHKLNQLKKNGKITDTQIFKFKQEALQFLHALCKHIMTKSPLTYHFARCLRCLSPVIWLNVESRVNFYSKKF